MINKLKNEDSIRFLCETLDVPRSALYHQPRLSEEGLIPKSGDPEVVIG